MDTETLFRERHELKVNGFQEIMSYICMLRFKLEE